MVLQNLLGRYLERPIDRPNYAFKSIELDNRWQ
jgi:hypothetical protein